MRFLPLTFIARTTLAFLSIPAFASESQWFNIGPIKSDDMKAFVDYQIESTVPGRDEWKGKAPQGPSSFETLANPIWVNIHRNGLSASDKVFVQLITYGRSCFRGDCANIERISKRYLDFAESGRFTGRMHPVTLDFQLNDSYALSTFRPFKYEIVVWINDKLYKGYDNRNLRLPLPVSRR